MIPPAAIAGLIPGENPLVLIAGIPPSVQENPLPVAIAENSLPAVGLPLARQPFDRNWPVHNMGRMDVPCSECGALHWMCKKLTRSSKRDPDFGTCCFNGKIKLPKIEDLPVELLNYLKGQDPISKSFRENIRQYYNALAMTSLGSGVQLYKQALELHN